MSEGVKGMKSLAAALSVAHEEVGPVMKDATSSTSAYSHRYVKLDSLIDAYQMPLLRQGVTIRFTTRYGNEAGVMVVQAKLEHLESGEAVCSSVPMPMPKPSSKTPCQDVGAAMTYGRRYALECVLGLGNGRDDDGAGYGPALEQGGQVRNPFTNAEDAAAANAVLDAREAERAAGNTNAANPDDEVMPWDD